MVDLNITLQTVLNNGRVLDYYLIKNLYKPCEEEVIAELLKYQNTDGGFGHALEPDAQLPESSVLATDIAVEILESLKGEYIEIKANICKFYITQFNGETFQFVPKQVDEHPHAIWWNYDTLDGFGRFNPTPEVLGFLYKYKYLHSFDIDTEVEKMISLIQNEFLPNKSEHSLYSVIKFYNYLGKPIALEKVINQNIKELITLKEEEWKNYTPEPYKLVDKNGSLYSKYEEAYLRNIEYIKNNQSDDGVWYPEWKWFQYDEVFESKARFEWMGYITYQKLKIIKEG